jgi:CBS domain-containing protein
MRVDALRREISARLAVIGSGTAVRVAAAALSRPGIGLLVVCDRRDRIAGVVSKSDLVRHLTGDATADAPVAGWMTTNVISCRFDDDLWPVWRRMGDDNLQSLPVIGSAAEPIGVLDIRDALKALLDEETYQERLLARYVGGVGYQ